MEDGIIFRNGEIIEGRYEVIREIGRGGMSTVYLVRDIRLRKDWALKTVKKEAEDRENEPLRRSLLTEAEMLKKLEHPLLPRVIGVVETEQCFGVLMDYIEGRTLGTVLKTEGAQPETRVIAWAKQLCGVLLYLHGCDPPVIYRDMKPDNIMLRPDGSIALFDFGIAREYKLCREGDTQSLGTFGYAAPEQFGGHGQTTPQTDIFSLGATLYHLVTGVSPSEPPYGVRPIREWNPGLSEGLEAVLLKCAQRDPAKRYKDCAELMFALEHCGKEDAKSLRIARRRMAAFVSPLCAGILGLLLAVTGAAGKNRQKRELYARMLTRCSDDAVESVLRGEYRQEIFGKYTELIDLDPSRPEGYTGLLEYCEDTGRTEAGLRSVCVRIDAGAGHIDRNSEILMKTADLYFGGSRTDLSFSADYAKAAKYYAKADSAKYPEAVYLCRIAEALGARNGLAGEDWENIIEALRAFVSYTDRQENDSAKVKWYRLAAGVCISHKKPIAEAGTDPWQMASEMLRKALLCLNQTDEEDTETKKELLADLAGCLISAGGDEKADDGARTVNGGTGSGGSLADLHVEEALRCCRELLHLQTEEEERNRTRVKIAEITEMTGNAKQIRDTYEQLIEQAPEEASVRIRYCSWLLKEGKEEEAAQQYRMIRETGTGLGEHAFSVLEKKLSLAEKGAS